MGILRPAELETKISDTLSSAEKLTRDLNSTIRRLAYELSFQGNKQSQCQTMELHLRDSHPLSGASNSYFEALDKVGNNLQSLYISTLKNGAQSGLRSWCHLGA